MARLYLPRIPVVSPGAYRYGLLRLWLFIAATLVPGNLGALVNPGGPTSDSSQASLDVSLSVATLFRIGGIRDLDLGTYSGGGNISDNDDVCVWTNAASGLYRVTARGDGGSPGQHLFTVSKVGDATQVLPYSVRWNTQSGTAGNFSLTHDQITTNLSGANTESSTCASGPSATANYQVLFDQEALLAVRSGTYRGTLTLIISAPT